MSQEFLREDRLQVTCTALGGKDAFGYSASDIGTKSLRSGAAMTLFLMNHSTKCIMLLCRWKSAAFLVCVLPQVLEWMNDMSWDMIRHDSLLDVSDFNQADPALPQIRPRRFNGIGIGIGIGTLSSGLPPGSIHFSLVLSGTLYLPSHGLAADHMNVAFENQCNQCKETLHFFQRKANVINWACLVGPLRA
jgi:hypothetical protein